MFSLVQVAKARDFPKSIDEQKREELGSVISKDKETGNVTVFGKSLFGSSNKEQEAKPEGGMAHIMPVLVDTYLWQASLEAVQFMPLLVSDSSGGAISTDWYEDANFQNERYKFNILIKSKKLINDSVAVSAFKQIYVDSRWKDVKANPAIAEEMKKKILIRAAALKANDKYKK
jgi:hypothetical protein